MDFLSVLREFGPFVGGGIIALSVLALAVRMLFYRLETAHAREIESLKEGREREVTLLKEALQRISEERRIWQAQAERLAERYGESTQVASDLAQIAFERRQGQRPQPRRADG